MGFGEEKVFTLSVKFKIAAKLRDLWKLSKHQKWIPKLLTIPQHLVLQPFMVFEILQFHELTKTISRSIPIRIFLIFFNSIISKNGFILTAI